MPMKPGTVAHFTDSLAEAIENAMKMEWRAVKGETLPAEGQDDRRVLFVAIAQGILDYLKDHQADFNLVPPAGEPAHTMDLRAPALTLSVASGPVSTVVTTSGSRFGGSAAVTVTWDNPATDVLNFVADANGAFSGQSFTVPAGASVGRHVVTARDNSGSVAMAIFTII
jgi:hypothetical protein